MFAGGLYGDLFNGASDRNVSHLWLIEGIRQKEAGEKVTGLKESDRPLKGS